MTDEHLTRDEAEEIARNAAELAVERVMLRMGVDPASPEAMREFREDSAFLRRQRKGAEQVAAWTKRSIVSAVVGGFLWLLWEGFKARGGG